MKDIYWKAQDYEYREKRADWYWIVWAITALLIFIVYYLFEDVIFSGLILIMAIILTLASFKKPSIKRYSLDEKSVHFTTDKKNIAYSDIASYKVDLENMKILINTTNKIQPLVHIPFAANQNAQKIDDFLSKKIKKDESLQIPVLELLLNRFLGF